MHFQSRFIQVILSSTWLRRLFALLVIAVVVVLGMFFLVFALVVGALMATIMFGRLWWQTRKLRATRNDGVIEGYFSVEPESLPTIDPEKTVDAAKTVDKS